MKSNKQYIVHDKDINKREELYNYLEKESYTFLDGPKEYYVNNKFPFVIENNVVWICTSITCCAAAAQCGAILTTQEYYNALEQNSKTRNKIIRIKI